MKAEEYSERAKRYFSEGNYDRAIADLTEVIRLEPDNPFAFWQRGMCYTNKNELDLAITDFNKAIQLAPNRFSDFYFDRAGANIYKGNITQAIADMEIALKIDPQNESYREVLKELKGG